jgi:hypothetical protein
VTGRPGCLLVWDVRLPDPVKIVRLGKEDPPAPIRSIRSNSFSFLQTVKNGGFAKINRTDLTLKTIKLSNLIWASMKESWRKDCEKKFSSFFCPSWIPI